ncbi:MAG: hypothetical protein NT013_12760, partial [Planctomycetia bacterium]|nr:hypothetical protein [Planctomycetia bacterium]
LEAECKAINGRVGLTGRGDALVWWYFTKLHGFTDQEVAEIFCDGGGDLGLDAIWIDDDQRGNFYQFKNPESLSKGVGGGDIDKVISGLMLILAHDHESVANENLKARLEDVYASLPSGYRLHVVSSGQGIPNESEVKLNSFASKLNTSSAVIFDWESESLTSLQDRFYQKSLPAIEAPVSFEVGIPHTARSGNADC